jgi:hypothetical protein
MSATSSRGEQIVETQPVVTRLRAETFNRATAHEKHQTSVIDHHAARADLLQAEMQQLVNTTAADLLKELRAQGLLWSMVASVVGVSDAAIRKWRRGESIEPTHHGRLVLLTALSHIYVAYGDPTLPFAAWIDSEIVPRFSATPLQLIALNRDSDAVALQPLLDLMLLVEDGPRPEEILDRYLGPTWRDEAVAEQRFRIITTASGDRLLVVDE